jgi:hypothetical protein
MVTPVIRPHIFGWQHQLQYRKNHINSQKFLTWPFVYLVQVFAFHAMVLYIFYLFCVGHSAEKLPVSLHQSAKMQTSPPTYLLYRYLLTEHPFYEEPG